MIRVITGLNLLVSSVLLTDAHAFCPEPAFYLEKTFETKVNDNFKHLICLHNEQVSTLNEHASEINKLYDIASKLNKSDTISQPNEKLLRELLSRYESIAVENVFLKARLDAVEKKIQDIKLNE